MGVMKTNPHPEAIDGSIEDSTAYLNSAVKIMVVNPLTEWSSVCSEDAIGSLVTAMTDGTSIKCGRRKVTP